MGDIDKDDVEELEYEGHLPPLEDIEATVTQAWQEAWATDAELRALYGASSSAAAPPAPFSLDRTQGADPLSAVLIVMAARVGAAVSKRMVLDIWRKIILPKLERRWGEGAAREVRRRRRK